MNTHSLAMTISKSVAVVTGAALLLTSCGTDEGNGMTNGTDTTDGSTLTELLSRTEQLPVSRLRIEYINQARMRELADTNEWWSVYQEQIVGKPGSYPENVYRTTGIDLLAADRLYYVGYAGVFGENIELIEGGQDTDAIATVAEVGGWFRDGDTFGAPADSPGFEAGAFEWMILGDASVLRGEEDSYMEGVRFADSGESTTSGSSFGGDEELMKLAECVGDAVMVTILDVDVLGLAFRGTDRARGQIAVGLLADEVGEARTVVCAHSDDADQLGEDIQAGIDAGVRREDPVENWSDYITSADIEVDGRLVRAVLTPADGAAPDEIVTSLNLMAYGLPGFSE